jgi:ATPase subunit of ABC transporter with duplicated ATPase domains
MQADSKRSKKHLDRHDSDGRAKIDLARLTGKDAVAGRLQKQMEKRVLRASDELGRIEYIKEKRHVIFLPGSKSRRNYIFKTERQVIGMGNKTLVIPRLILDTCEKVAITGSNGAGKSTFINFMMRGINTEEEHICYIPQEITKVQSDKIWMRIRAMKGADLGRVLVIISNLGSDQKQLLQSVSPSPGETRKLMLAMGIMKTPHIIVMDEPTNHMDIISIQCLEAALKECPCAVVLVSHDIKFLNAITDKNWHIECRENESFMLTETRRTGFNDVMKG